MAKVLRIANFSQANTYDLLAGNLKLIDAGWKTQRASGNEVYETFQLIADGVTDANIITAENTISTYLDRAGHYFHDRIFGDSYWLEANATSETARRSLIYPGGVIEPGTIGIVDQLLGSQGQHGRFSLALRRHPAWEEITVSTNSTTNVSTLGGKWLLTDFGGTMDARLAELRIIGRSGGGGDQTRFWVGMRETGPGTTDYESLMECESGTLGTDTSSAVDAAASGGNVAECTFATVATLAERVTMRIGAFSSTPRHMVGRYLVLLRCYVDSGTVAAVQLKSGYAKANAAAPNREVFNISNTAGELIELGTVQMPPMGYRRPVQVADVLDQFEIQLWAERTSGSGSLFMDCIVLIPADRFVYLDNVTVVHDGQANQTEVYTFEDDTHSAVAWDDTGTGLFPDSSAISGFNGWKYPKDGGVLVIAGQRDAGNTVTDTCDLALDVYPRWHNYAT